MKSRLAILFALLPLVIAAAPPASPDDDPEPAIYTKRYSSPKAVFDAYVAAEQKKDHKTALDCLSPESQKDMAAFTAYLMIFIRNSEVPEEVKKEYKPVFDVMDKHGLTQQATKVVEIEQVPFKLPEKARTTLRKLIKKPGPFLIEVGKAADKADEKLLGGQERGKTTLEELKTQGNKATGKIVTTTGGLKMKQKVTFVKSNAGWKMELGLEFEQEGGFAVPAPPPVEKK